MSQAGRELDIQTFRIDREPFYAEVRGEIVSLRRVDVGDAHDLKVAQRRFGEHRAIVLGDTSAADEGDAHRYLRLRAT